MTKSILKRSRDVLIETAEELVFGFDYAHPESESFKRQRASSGKNSGRTGYCRAEATSTSNAIQRRVEQR
jgi:hypothetical protein